MNGYVYCTECYYFRLCDEHKPYCIYENKCDINDPEDSKQLKYRPYYEKLKLDGKNIINKA